MKTCIFFNLGKENSNQNLPHKRSVEKTRHIVPSQLSYFYFNNHLLLLIVSLLIGIGSGVEILTMPGAALYGN